MILKKSVLRTSILASLLSRDRSHGVLFGSSGDQYWSNVVSLLHFDGTDGSTTFTDQKGKTWVATGASLQAFGQKYGTACGNFDAIGRYIDCTSSDFTFGTGDFTIEGWIYGSATGGKIYADLRPASTNGKYPTIYSIDSTLYFYTDSANRITGSSVLSASTWQHIALCRASGTTRLFVGGYQVGPSYSDSNDYIGSRLRLGNGGDNPVSTGMYLDEWRVTKGVARYTANFTPPTAAFQDS